MDKSQKFQKFNKNKNKNKPYSNSIKSTMCHVRGLPPAPNWGNRFCAIVIEHNLLYISNNYIINIDLIKKEFYQMINSNCIDEEREKFILIANINSDMFLAVTCKSKFIIFQKYSNTNNLEDKRVYFKEIKKFYFSEIDSLSLDNVKDKNEENSFRPQSVTVILKDNIIICGDNQGSIHIIKLIQKTYTNKDNNEVEVKYLYSMMVGSLKNYVTDLLILQKLNLLIFSTSKGDILKYSIYKDNLSKIEENLISPSKQEKFIMSIDYLEIEENKILLVSIDKNGSLSIYLIENYLDQIISTNIQTTANIGKAINTKLLLFEKNKFNDKSIEEKYVYFTVKFLKNCSNESIKLIVTSNKGKFYFSNFSFTDFFKENNKISTNYTEITDNPHEMVIYNILEYKDKLIFISADNIISFFKSPEILFEYDIKTIGKVIKNLHHNNTKNFSSNINSIYLFTEKNSIIQYNYKKKLNGLMSVIRKRHTNRKKSKEKSSVDVLLTQQANFNQDVFALVTYNQSNKFTYIEIYYFSSDYRISKLKYESTNRECKILNLMFHADSRIYKDDLKIQNELISELDRDREANSFINTIDEIFMENKNYDLLYILDNQGLVTVWDFIYNKINRFKISDQVIESSLIYPLKNSYLLNIRKSSCINDEVKISIFNQICYTDIGKFKSEDTTMTLPCILDYFYFCGENINTDINQLFILHIVSNTNLNVLHFKDLSILNSKINEYVEYSNFCKTFTINKNLKEEKFNFRKIESGCLTNLPVKNIEIHKFIKNSNKNFENENCVYFKFIISQSDNVIKIFDFKYNSKEEVYSIILKYSINAHLNKIIQVKWITEDFIASVSLDHSLKLWDIRMCRALDLCLSEKRFSINQESGLKIDDMEQIKLTNNIIKINSMCLFQQSFKSCQEFVNFFEISYDDLNNSKSSEDEITDKLLSTGYTNQVGLYDMLIFSFFKDRELNHKIACKVIQIEIQNILESNSIIKFLPNLAYLIIYAMLFIQDAKEKEINFLLPVLKKKLQNINLNQSLEKKGSLDLNSSKTTLTYEKIEDIINNFSNLEYLTTNYSSIFSSKFLEILYENNYSCTIQNLINNNLYVEAIILLKLFKMDDFKLLILILDKLRSFIYPKQNFQAMKIKRVSEILTSYISSNNPTKDEIKN